MSEEKTVFISYRRDKGFYEARAIFQDLRAHGYDAFWDIESIDSGTFDTIILNQIAARAHFLLVLTPGTLDRTARKGDWLRREIEHAIDLERNIVPVTMKGFKIEDGEPFYTGKLAKLPRYNALDVPGDYFDAGMGKLRKRFLKQPVRGSIIPTPAADQQVVDEKIKKASAVEDSPEERPDRMAPGWKQSVFGRLGALPRGLLYFGGGIVLILILALVFWGGNRLFGSLRGTESPTPIVTTAVAVQPTKANTLRPAATDTSRPATATLPGDTQEPSITDTPTRGPTHMPSPTITPSPTLEVLITDDYSVPMALVPAGLFEMGSQDGDDNEKPVHIITLGDFYIDQYEVTNARYAECVDAGPCDRPKNNSSDTRNKYYGSSTYVNYPVIFVNWDDARTYCEWRGAHLPTEAEWEKAARGGLEGELYPWGNGSPDCSLANFNNVRLCVGDTSAVGSYGPNSYQLFDMAGNVWEWVQSLYDDYPYDPADGRENVNLAGLHVLRGGAWGSGGSYLRVAYRYVNDLSSTTNSIGFRCARTP